MTPQVSEPVLILKTPEQHPLIGKFLKSGKDIVEVTGIGMGGRHFEHYAQVKYPHGLVWVWLPWVLVWERVSGPTNIQQQ